MSRKLKISFLLTITLLILLDSVLTAEVSYASLKSFWESTYDTDKNGEANLQDFIEYFSFLEPEHQVEKDHAEPIFNFFDADGDLKVTL